MYFEIQNTSAQVALMIYGAVWFFVNTVSKVRSVVYIQQLSGEVHCCEMFLFHGQRVQDKKQVIE